MLLLALVSCVGAPATESDETDASTDTDVDAGLVVPDHGPLAEGVTPALFVDAASAFDPYEASVVITAGTRDLATPIRVRVLDDTGAVMWYDEANVSTGYDATFAWDGRDPAGAPLRPGEYRIEVLPYEPAGLQRAASAVTPIRVVRAAFTDVYASDDGGATALRVPLYWHGDQKLQDVALAISHLAAIEDGDEPADFPELGSELYAAGVDAEPVAWRYDSRPILAFTPGTATLHGSTGLDEASIGVQIEGWTVVSGLPMRPGVQVVLQKDEPLSTTIGVLETPLDIQFTAADASDEPVVIGHQALPVRFYALLDGDTFRSTGAQYNPWVAAIDPALRGIDGTEPTHDAVVDALTAWVYTQTELSYDTRYGASAYVSYGRTWESAKFFFEDFLDRSYGPIVNCTDCASILLTYANMVGAELNYTIILSNFGLNQIKAIGGSAYTNCPFGAGGCGFSYHAVTTDDAGGTIWDATLALDGDSDPGKLPATELLVQQIPGDEYLDRLVKSGTAYYDHESQGTMQ